MKSADKFILIIERCSSSLPIVYYYEYVYLNEMEQFRIDRTENSACYKLQITSNSTIIAQKSDKERFDWFNDKYLLDSTAEVYDKASDLKLARPFLDWIASRI